MMFDFYKFIEARAGVLLVALAMAFAAYMTGRSDGNARCVASQIASTQEAQVQANTTVRKAIARGSKTGRAREADRSRLDAKFAQLAEEAHDDPIASADDERCALPAERLRRWAAANAGGSNPGAAAAEPDGAAAGTAAAYLWPAARLGSQPPRGGAPLSPAGQPDVPAAELPAAAE